MRKFTIAAAAVCAAVGTGFSASAQEYPMIGETSAQFQLRRQLPPQTGGAAITPFLGETSSEYEARRSGRESQPEPTPRMPAPEKGRTAIGLGTGSSAIAETSFRT